MRAPRRVLAASTLTLEAFVVFFAALVAKDLTRLSTGQSLALFGGLALACLLAAGMLRSRAGFAVGTALQVAVIATGVLVPTMLFLGLVFAGLWAASLYWGARIERERAAYVPPPGTRGEPGPAS